MAVSATCRQHTEELEPWNHAKISTKGHRNSTVKSLRVGFICMQPVCLGLVSFPLSSGCGSYIRNPPVVVADTVNSAVWVYGERLTLKTLSADDAAETGWVVGFPTSLQDLMRKNELFFTQCKRHDMYSCTVPPRYIADVLVLHLSVSVFCNNVLHCNTEGNILLWIPLQVWYM